MNLYSTLKRDMLFFGFTQSKNNIADYVNDKSQSFIPKGSLVKSCALKWKDLIDQSHFPKSTEDLKWKVSPTNNVCTLAYFSFRVLK